MAERPQVLLYSGAGCCLCERALVVIEAVARDVAFDLEVRDIANDAAWAERFGQSIPAIAIDGSLVMERKVSEFWLRRALRGEPIGRFQAL